MNGKLTVGSCFSGIGGLELGLEWTGGFETKWQIEIDPYASAVLAKHWPNVKRYGDITNVDGGILESVDLICGGFPCQDVSLAGKRAGLDGKRTTLWAELFRLVREVKPRWFLGENVPGLLSANDGRFFGNILRDLASIGFDVEWGVLSAAGVGAPHLRRRVFILAHPMRSSGGSELGQQQNERAEVAYAGGAGDVADTKGEQSGRLLKPGIQRNVGTSGALADTAIDPRRISDRDGQNDVPHSSCKLLDGTRKEGNRRPESPNGNWWSTEPNVGRVAHGISKRVDRLKCLGNAVVPACAEKVGRMILEYENSQS